MKKPLTFHEYVEKSKTDNSSDEELSIKYSIDMLLDEASTIYRYYSTSKTLSDGDRYLKEMVPSKAGDILWYVSNICQLVGADLEKVANANLEKIQKRWGENEKNKLINYDEGFRSNEKFPRNITFYLQGEYESDPDCPSMVNFSYLDSGRIKSIGDPIDDNSRKEDYYRFHDIFHVSYLAYLGWSPVVRKMLKKERKSNIDIARAEDGARARDIEEALTSFIYIHSLKHITSQRKPVIQEVVDFRTHRTIDRLVSGLEVRSRPRDWWLEALYNAILASRFAIKNHGCELNIDLDARKLNPTTLPESMQIS